MPAPQRILIIKLVEQGATVIAEPALRRAVTMVGRENVFMVVFEENRFILDILDVIPPENVITMRSGNLVHVALDTLRVLWRMRRENIDTAVDFEFFSRFSGLLTYLSGARRRVGFHSYGGEAGYRGDLMTHRIAYNVSLHAIQIYTILIEAIMLPADKLPALDIVPTIDGNQQVFRATPGEIQAVESMLRRVLSKQAIPPLLLFNSNSGDLLPLRRWHSERYIELAQRLLDKYPDAVIGFTGAPDEREAAQVMVNAVASDRCVNLAGETTLRQLMVLYGLAEVMVTNDSGPAHFASLTPIDVVTLFGPETPAVFGSRSPRSHIIWAGLACSPCVNAFNQRVTSCKENRCMARISVDEVFATVCRVYEQRKPVTEFDDLAAGG